MNSVRLRFSGHHADEALILKISSSRWFGLMILRYKLLLASLLDGEILSLISLASEKSRDGSTSFFPVILKYARERTANIAVLKSDF